ncbi:exported hypothetical protein [Candidatus Sulfopaludibacter sp. SbA3]|nr:exported hypothetical protein [Candidatus Sulfopaludibacter sp. SbA3]
MKKILAAAAVLLLGIGAWSAWTVRRHLRHSAQRATVPHAMMFDEDAPREIVPSVSLQVNEELAATVPAGTPLWFTVGINNAAAINELSAAQALATRLAHIAKDAPDRRRLQTDYDRRSRPATIALGDAARPWTEAVQLLMRDAQGGERALTIPVRRMGDPAGVVALDAYSSARANFGVAEADAPPGIYSVVACLGLTGSWHGRACSPPVRLTVEARPPSLAPDRQSVVDRRSGRFALIARDAGGLEQAGRKLIAADAGDVEGHMYMGEARYLQSRWTDALAEFATARNGFRRSHPGAGEPPRFLDVRISQILNRLDAGQ